MVWFLFFKTVFETLENINLLFYKKKFQNKKKYIQGTKSVFIIRKIRKTKKTCLVSNLINIKNIKNIFFKEVGIIFKK